MISKGSELGDGEGDCLRAAAQAPAAEDAQKVIDDLPTGNRAAAGRMRFLAGQPRPLPSC